MGRWRDVKQGKIERPIKEEARPVVSNLTACCDASLMDRFKAFVTDTFMLTMPLIYIVFYFVMGSREEFGAHKLLGWLYIFGPHFILIVSLWYFKAQTPGLKAYELSVVSSCDGSKAGFISLTNRYFQTAIAIILIFPMFFPYLNKKRRTLQDIVSGTCIKKIPNKANELPKN